MLLLLYGHTATVLKTMFRTFLLGLFIGANTSIACPDASELEQNDFAFTTFASGDWFIAGQQAHPFVNPVGTCRKGSISVDKDDDECMVMLNTQELFGSLAGEGLPDMFGSSLCACANSDGKLKSGRFTWGEHICFNTRVYDHMNSMHSYVSLLSNQVFAVH